MYMAKVTPHVMQGSQSISYVGGLVKVQTYAGHGHGYITTFVAEDEAPAELTKQRRAICKLIHVGVLPLDGNCALLAEYANFKREMKEATCREEQSGQSNAQAVKPSIKS